MDIIVQMERMFNLITAHEQMHIHTITTVIVLLHIVMDMAIMIPIILEVHTHLIGILLHITMTITTVGIVHTLIGTINTSKSLFHDSRSIFSFCLVVD